MTRVLVIGDTIIDEDVHALGSGLSLESPTIKANFREKTYSTTIIKRLSTQIQKALLQI